MSNETKLVRNFGIGERVTYTYGKHRAAIVVANANRTPFDERANYRLSVDGIGIRVVNEAWIQRAAHK